MLARILRPPLLAPLFLVATSGGGFGQSASGDETAHWAYQPLTNPSAPGVENAAWPAGEIDQFVLANLEAVKLFPAEEAAPDALVRRLYFDLTGLPPEPEAIEAFAADPSFARYTALVDELLASRRFAEHWGRRWLDVARYAESVTLRGFVLPGVWRYRDYVIDSFHRDRRFDDFVRHQIAGDLIAKDESLPLEERQQLLAATAFLLMGNTNFEDQDKKKLEMDVVDEQLDTLGRAFLGQTLGCARCHDHKFDPIPARDYFAMAAILKNAPALKHDNVSKWIERALPLSEEKERAYADNAKRISAIEADLNAARDKLKSLGEGTTPNIIQPSELPGIIVDSSAAEQVGAWKLSQYSGRFIGDGYLHDDNNGKGEKTLTFLPELPDSGRYEVLLAYSHGGSRSTAIPVTILHAEGETTVEMDQIPEPPIDRRFVSLGTYRFEKGNQGYVMISNSGTSGHVTADAVQFLAEDTAEETEPDDETDDAPSDEAARLAEAALKDLEEHLKTAKDALPPRPAVMGFEEDGELEVMHIHLRGNVHEPGAQVERGFLAAAAGNALPDDAFSMPANESGRRELAEWVASRDNPMTPRVIANRVWLWAMGDGIVRTPDNFGTTGELPTHPELLDYLARQLVEQNWSIKSLAREIVLSRTYRQSSRASAEARSADPGNRLWSRAMRKRLPAEAIRDAMLAVSGELSLETHAPTPDRSSDYDFSYDGTQRSVYVPVFRNALPEIFEAFDFPDPSSPSGKRTASNVAPQALYLMNHPFVAARAKAAASRLLQDAPEGDVSALVTAAWMRTLGREPSPGERTAAEAFVKDSPSSPEAWTELMHSLFASPDFRYAN